MFVCPYCLSYSWIIEIIEMNKKRSASVFLSIYFANVYQIPEFDWHFTFSMFAVFLSSSFGTFIGQHTLRILRRHLCRKIPIRSWSDFTILQVSQPYSSTAMTFDLKNHQRWLPAYSLLLHTLLSLLNAPQAFPILALMSSAVPPDLVMVAPR